MILNKMKKTTKRQLGFTLVEMLVVAPIVILVIGIFINSIISMTGDILSVRASNNMVYQIQDALDRIDTDVKLSGGFLATNNIPITSPQGYNNDSTTFRNASSVNGNALMLNAYATGNNPYNPTKKIMYLSNQPNACSSANINQNAAMTHNIVYFVKNNTLWRRVIMPSNYETVGCYNGSVAAPWQQPSCAPSITGTICKTQDEKLVDNVQAGGLSINYYPNSISSTANTIAGDSAQSDSLRQAALQSNSTVIVSITSSSTVAGRDINHTGTIKSATTNNNISSATINAPTETTLALDFNSSSDLTSNFTQVIANGSQTVTGGMVQMRSNAADVQNSITSNWTMNKINNMALKASFSFSSSAASYNYANFSLKILDPSHAVIGDFSFIIGYNYTYPTNPGWTYWNSGYTWWSITGDPNVQANAIAKRLATAPTQAQHTYELVNNGSGYIQYKLDGVNVGSPMYLGDPTYNLGGPFLLSQLNCWWNQYSYVDIDSLTVTYS